MDKVYYRNKRKRAMFLTQVEIWWSVSVKVPEGVRPSPANTGQLRMNVLAAQTLHDCVCTNLKPYT